MHFSNIIIFGLVGLLILSLQTCQALPWDQYAGNQNGYYSPESRSGLAGTTFSLASNAELLHSFNFYVKQIAEHKRDIHFGFPSFLARRNQDITSLNMQNPTNGGRNDRSPRRRTPTPPRIQQNPVFQYPNSGGHHYISDDRHYGTGRHRY
jgi:hypothetical protein